MAKGRPNKPSPVPPSVSQEQALNLLKMQRQKGQALLDKGEITASEAEAWKTAIEEVLRRSFGSDSPNIDRIANVNRWALYGAEAPAQFAAQRITDMKDRLAIIDELIDLLASDVGEPAAARADGKSTVTLTIPTYGNDDRGTIGSRPRRWP